MGQRVAIYCRVSTEDQNCKRQERDMRALAARARHEIVGVFTEKASGARNDRVERKKVLALAQAREIEAILVAELSHWGRSTNNGKLMRTLIAGLAEFERGLIRERVKSGLARVQAAIERDGHFITKGGKKRAQLGRKKGYRPSEKHVGKVLELHKEGLSYRLIGRNIGLSKNTVMEIVRRAAA